MLNFITKQVLIGIDRLLQKWYGNKELQAGPIFIVGPPRSGSTVLYQLLINTYQLGYMSNLQAKFCKAPIAGKLIELTAIPVIKILKYGNLKPYQSYYGKTSGWLGPHEVGEFWYRWFPSGQHVYIPLGGVSTTVKKDINETVSAMSNLEKAPMIFKNLFNSMRIGPLSETFPKAMFIVCRRNILDTAQSILYARQSVGKGKEEWWSVSPKEVDLLKQRPYWEQVIDQILLIYAQIEEDAMKIGPGRFHDIQYECLCSNPKETLSKLEFFLESHNVPVTQIADIPKCLQFTSGSKISGEDYELLRKTLEERRR